MPEPKPHPLNVDGPFYVEDGCCTCCDLPRALAPDMFKFNEANDHCYVFSQPKTEDQSHRMVEAVAGAELACIRYRGHEKDVLRLLKKKGAQGCVTPWQARHNSTGAVEGVSSFPFSARWRAATAPNC